MNKLAKSSNTTTRNVIILLHYYIIVLHYIILKRKIQTVKYAIRVKISAIKKEVVLSIHELY